MAITILHENDYSKVYFDTDLNAGIIDWKDKKLSSEEYRSAFNKLLEYTKDKNIFVNYLADTRLQSVISPEDRKWFQNNIIPEAITHGLKRGAVIISGNAFKKFYMNMIIKGSKMFPIEIKMFDNQDKAKAWLKSLIVNIILQSELNYADKIASV